jgi:hypothetical protein
LIVMMRAGGREGEARGISWAVYLGYPEQDDGQVGLYFLAIYCVVVIIILRDASIWAAS